MQEENGTVKKENSSGVNKKLIIEGCVGALAFVFGLLLVVIIVFTSIGNSKTKNIERVLNEDSKTHDNVTSVAQVVQRMQAIDINGYPKEFKQAYLAHIGTWQEMAAVEREAHG